VVIELLQSRQQLIMDTMTAIVQLTEAAQVSDVEAVVRSPNKDGRRQDCAAVDFSKMTSLDRPACGHVCWGRSASQSTTSNASAVLIGRKKSRNI